MATPSQARLRAFVREHTRLVAVPGLPGLRIHTGADVMALCQQAGELLGQADPDLPYWAFPWAGGLAVAHHLAVHPDEVAGGSVLDLAAGSGLCGIAAVRAGATAVEAVDVDPLAGAAVWLNARANGVRLGFIGRDLLDEAPPLVDVILAGDVCYQAGMAGRILPWLRRAASAGTRVLLGDPGRAHLPGDLEAIATYDVQTSRELETAGLTPVSVYALGAPGIRR